MDRDIRIWRHLCIDMQRLFAEETPWHVGWAHRVLPAVERLSRAAPEKTIFTRFLPPRSASAAPGMWRQYYEKWWMMTGEHVDPALLDLVAPLESLTPPAIVFDKTVYSPWLDGRLHRHLVEQGVGTLAISGGETDVCVLATVLGAVDLGYRIILLKDGVCSGSDPTHDASLAVIGGRFSVQAEVMETDEFIDRFARPLTSLSTS